MNVSILTNNKNFPEALLRAMENDPYSKGNAEFSITELLQPPRVRALKKRHEHEIVEDAEDLLYRLYGQIVHGILERANESDLVEQRFFADFDGVVVSGQIDSLVLKDGVLSDWKFTTAWAFKAGQEPKADWSAQLNMQAELMRMDAEKKGLPLPQINKLQINGLIRDFQKREAKYNESYPQAPVVIQDIPMWSREKTQSFIKMRIALHKQAECVLPECSDDERWAKPSIYAVMKGKRAIPGGLQYSLEAAEKICSENPGTRVEFRKGESTRCALYCQVNQFCLQYKVESNVKEEKQDAV